jgi:hypothetical protein
MAKQNWLNVHSFLFLLFSNLVILFVLVPLQQLIIGIVVRCSLLSTLKSGLIFDNKTRNRHSIIFRSVYFNFSA